MEQFDLFRRDLGEIHRKMLSDFYFTKMAAVNICYMLLLRWIVIYAYSRMRVASKRLKQNGWKVWANDLYRERDVKGKFNMLLQDLRLDDHEYFFQCFCMLPAKFEEVFMSCSTIYNEMLNEST